MKSIKKVVLTLMLVLTMIVSLLPTISVQAGDGSVVLGVDSLENAKAWNNLGDGVQVEGGKLIFPADSNQYTRFISMKEGTSTNVLSTVVKVDCSMKFTQLPEGESFVLAFGLDNIESGIGEVGNVEVTFTNDNGIKVGIVAYGEDKEPITVCEPKAIGKMVNSVISVEAEVQTGSIFTLQVDGKDIYSGSIPVEGSGKIGFLQTRYCGVEVTDLEAVLSKYDRPENTNITETFENGMDTSVLSARAIARYWLPIHGAGVKEYNGSNVYMMENIGLSYIGTIYDYSNFEMTFDVPYFLTATIADEKGDLAFINTPNFIVSFGAGETDSNTYGYESAAEALVWEGDIIYSVFNREEYTVNHKYWQSERPFSILVKVVDKYLTVGMKFTDETEFETVMEYPLDTTPLGKIHFYIPNWGTMAIDNLVITNLDKEPNLIETEFKSGTIVYEDFVYEPFERVYKEQPDDGLNTESPTPTSISPWYWMIPGAVVIGAAAIVATLLLNKKKGGQTNEE